MIRQPKYKMGQTVSVDLLFKHEPSGIERKIGIECCVSGVFYDPQSGITGCPFYKYNVVPKFGKTILVKEEDIYLET